MGYGSLAEAAQPVQLVAGESNYKLDEKLSYLRIQGRLMALDEVLNNGGHKNFCRTNGTDSQLRIHRCFILVSHSAQRRPN